jgi:AcrR family transcriptional regulator
MSPRPMRGEIRTALLENAARVLSEAGPPALSTRRLAAETGVSTTAVYTYFGAMPELVRAIVHEGFARLQARLARVEPTDDPLLDATRLTYVYQASALADPHLYRVMMGGPAIAGFELSLDDRKIGLETFRVGVEAVRRLMAEGTYAEADPWTVALSMWAAVHGHVMLDLNGYFLKAEVGESCFDQLVYAQHVGAGCPAERARAVVRQVRDAG